MLYRLEKLNEAVNAASKYTGGWSDNFYLAEDFYEALKEATEKLKKGDTSKLGDLFLWFFPTYDWDDFVGDVELGNEIFELYQLRNKFVPQRDKTDNEKDTNQ